MQNYIINCFLVAHNPDSWVYRTLLLHGDVELWSKLVWSMRTTQMCRTHILHS